jgi:hypothetical protein
LQPVSKTLGKETVREISDKKTMEQMSEPMPDWMPNWLQQAIRYKTFAERNIAADVVDMAQTPITYAPIPGSKALGKIPIKGTTLGEIAKNYPRE